MPLLKDKAQTYFTNCLFIDIGTPKSLKLAKDLTEKKIMDMPTFSCFTVDYLTKLKNCFDEELINCIYELKNDLEEAWINKNNIL